MADIQSLIPHRYPLLMIDRVTEIEPGKQARGYKNVTGNEWFINGQSNSMPGMMIVEALAQIGAFTAISGEKGIGFLSSLQGIEFLGNAYPGDRIELCYEVTKTRRGFVLGKGEASVADQVIVKAAEIMIFVQAD
ncbi:3-hydroxyacyl-ACP dehydratase FabZ family protein [Paenibacillus tarimensis]